MEYFILGMIMVQVLFPLMEGFTALVLSGFEALKGFFGLQVAKYNIRIHRLQDEEPVKKKPIGFMREEENNE